MLKCIVCASDSHLEIDWGASLLCILSCILMPGLRFFPATPDLSGPLSRCLNVWHCTKTGNFGLGWRNLLRSWAQKSDACCHHGAVDTSLFSLFFYQSVSKTAFSFMCVCACRDREVNGNPMQEHAQK